MSRIFNIGSKCRYTFEYFPSKNKGASLGSLAIKTDMIKNRKSQMEIYIFIVNRKLQASSKHYLMRTKVLEKKPTELHKRGCIKANNYEISFQFSQIIATLCFLFNELINIQRCVSPPVYYVCFEIATKHLLNFLASNQSQHVG